MHTEQSIRMVVEGFRRYVDGDTNSDRRLQARRLLLHAIDPDACSHYLADTKVYGAAKGTLRALLTERIEATGVKFPELIPSVVASLRDEEVADLLIGSDAELGQGNDTLEALYWEPATAEGE